MDYNQLPSRPCEHWKFDRKRVALVDQVYARLEDVKAFAFGMRQVCPLSYGILLSIFRVDIMPDEQDNQLMTRLFTALCC